MKRCHNCGAKYRWEPDAEYKFRLVHDDQTCPYRFDFAHNDRATIWKWVREFVRRGFRFA